MAGRPKRRARLIKAHKAEIHKGRRRCKKCGKNHTLSEHWSHVHGTHKGAKGETAWYGRKKRPQGKRKIRKPAKRKARRKSSFKRGGTTFGPIRTTRTRRLPRRSAAEMLAMGRAARKSAKRTRKAKRSPAQKAATARMLAALAAKRGGGGGRKRARKAVRKSGRRKGRSPAQKAATLRMLAAAAAKRGKRFLKVKRSSGSPRPIPMHLVRGHLASNPGRKPGKHRVAAHLSANPDTLTAADRAHNRRLARKFNRKSRF